MVMPVLPMMVALIATNNLHRSISFHHSQAKNNSWFFLGREGKQKKGATRQALAHSANPALGVGGKQPLANPTLFTVQ